MHDRTSSGQHLAQLTVRGTLFRAISRRRVHPWSRTASLAVVHRHRTKFVAALRLQSAATSILSANLVQVVRICSESQPRHYERLLIGTDYTDIDGNKSASGAKAPAVETSPNELIASTGPTIGSGFRPAGLMGSRLISGLL